MKCVICGQEYNNRTSFCNHINKKHQLDKKTYYDLYLKKIDEGICKYNGCNNPTSFINIEVGYKDCCCLEHTNLYRYGVKSNLNFKEIKEKAQKNSHTAEANQKGLKTRIDRYGGSGFSSKSIRKKIETTNLEKYGVKNVFSNKQVREKCSKTKQLRYGDKNYNNRSKAVNTWIDKYNVTHPMQLKSVRDKCKTTCLNRYGVENNLQLKSVIQHAHSIEAQYKRIIFNRNRILNGNYKNNIEKLFMSLCNQYNIKVIPEYYSTNYPFACDFYMPEKDLYIEVNIHWSHGKHWFNESNQDDIDKLDLWKSKNNLYYDRAINIWTISDLKKRNIAKKNNLNYVVLWSENEITNWFNNNCEIRQDWK